MWKYVLVLISFKSVTMIISSFKMHELTFAFNLWIILFWFIFKAFKEKINKMMMSIFKTNNEYKIILFSYSVFAKKNNVSFVEKTLNNFYLIWFKRIFMNIFKLRNQRIVCNRHDWFKDFKCIRFRKTSKKSRSRKIHFIAHVKHFNFFFEWTLNSTSWITKKIDIESLHTRTL
jgi:hypothetical protein